jgi:hypothetical protein
MKETSRKTQSMTTSRSGVSGEDWLDQALRLNEQFRVSALTTLPADRATTERALAGQYALMGLPVPRFLWFDSPLSCMLAAHILQRFDQEPTLGKRLDEQFRRWHWDFCFGIEEQIATEENARDDGVFARLDDAGYYGPSRCCVPINDSVPLTLVHDVRRKLAEGLWCQLDDQIASSTGVLPWRSAWYSIEHRLSVPLWVSLDDVTRNNSSPFLKGFWNSEGLSWVAHYLGCEYAGARFDGRTREYLGTLRALHSACGWWFPFEHAALCSERPQQIGLDAARRVHSERGPSLRFRDGSKFYAWHGVVVPLDWIEQRDTLDPSIALAWPNIQQRRAAAEIIGGENVHAVDERR